MTVCQVEPNEFNERKVTPPPKYSDSVLKALEDLRTANVELPEARLAEMARTPEGQARLKRTIEENYFLRLLANRVTLRPGSGNAMSQWIARHFPALLSRKTDLSKVRQFLEEAGSGGAKLIDTLSLTGDTAAGLTTRMLIAPMMENGYKNVRKSLRQGGVTLSKDVIDRMWVDAVELARVPVMYRKVSEGVLSDGAYRAMTRKYDRFLQRVSSYGMGEESVKVLLREAESVNKAFEDLHAISDLAQLGVGDITNAGIQYFPRQFTSDFKFRVRRLDSEVEQAFLRSPGLGFSEAMNKSRTTYDLLPEDELMLASVLGLVDDTTENRVKRLRNLVNGTDAEVDVPGMRADAINELYSVREERARLKYVQRRKQFERANPEEAARVKHKRKLREAELEYRAASPADAPAANDEALQATYQRKVQRADNQLEVELERATQQRLELEQKELAELEKLRVERDSKLFERSSVVDETVREAKDELARLTNEATDKLAELVDQDGLLARELVKLPTPLIERLVDSGVISKVPMTSVEVAEHLIKKYDLPYSGIDELMVVDPVQAYRKAKGQLSDRLRKSFTIKGMSKQAIEDGWGVTATQRAASPEYKNFVQLSQAKLELAGIDAPDGLYFHPMVADAVHTIIDVSTDPASLGTLASIWQYTWQLAKEQVLTTSGFMGRQVMQLFISSALSGTNMAHIPTSISDWVKFGKGGVDVFDNVRKFKVGDVEYTMRDVVVEAIKRGVLDNDVGVGIGFTIGKSGDPTGNPLKIGKALQNWGAAATGQGAIPRVVDGKVRWDAVEYGAGLVGRLSGDAAAKVMGYGIWMEQAYKLAFLKTKIDLSLGNALGQFVVGRKPRSYDSLDDIFTEMGNYFLDYGTAGMGDRMISKNIAPFWMYMSRSMPAVFRHVIQNPTQYITYQRLYHLANEDVRQRGEDAPEGGFAPWQQGPYAHIYLPHPSGDPEKFIHIPFSAIDPVGDVLNRTDDIANSVLRLLGYHTGNSKEQLDQIDPRQSSNVIRDVFGQFGAFKTLAGLVTGTDDRGRSLKLRPDQEWETMLGLPLVGGEYSPRTRFIIENTFPAIANLDRWNPGEVFGLREKKDPWGEVIRDGKPSVFGFNRTASDSDVDDLANGGLIGMVNMARAAGLTVNSVNTLVGMGYTTKQMDGIAKELKRTFAKYEKASVDTNLSPQQRAKARQAMVTAAALYLEVETGKLEGGLWLNARDYLTPAQQDKAERAALKRLKKQAKAEAKRAKQVSAITRTAPPAEVEPPTIDDVPTITSPRQIPPDMREEVFAQ